MESKTERLEEERPEQGRVFVLGDIHGAYRALIECLTKAEFDYERDHLICLGDVCDGWPETKRCIDELLKITHLTYVMGNHDLWLLKWMQSGHVENIWYVQGGEATIDSYAGSPVPEQHISFLCNAVHYHVDNQNRLFVHAGIDPKKPLHVQGEDTFLWDRGLAKQVLQLAKQSSADERLSAFSEVYLGHTPVFFGKPLHAGEVWMMDTGAGWNGVLSLMDVNTKDTFVSAPVPSLYPGVTGRVKS